MKLGIGLYRAMLTPASFRFARQIGCTHVVAHLVDYHRRADDTTGARSQPVGNASEGWGVAGDEAALWTGDELTALRRSVEAEGLVLEAIENFDPAFWYDVLLDGPRRPVQMEGLKRLVRSIGAAGIPIMGYNFSIAGVAGRITGPFARGGAESVGVEAVDQTPVPLGMVWNMVYDSRAPTGILPPITPDQLWDRLRRFLTEMVPVAEEAGVKLAAHPDDPPAAFVRGTPRLVYRPDLYQRLLDIVPRPANALEFCLGTIAEMADGDVYEAAERYSAQGRLAYVHVRNVRGKMPSYREDFIDSGDVDMIRVLRILHRDGYDGVLIPDHTPLPESDAPWHVGMAYAVGWMRAALTVIEAEKRS
jgi:mannonate dehydratase